MLSHLPPQILPLLFLLQVSSHKLLLTPLLRKGSLDFARESAQVNDPEIFPTEVTSYSGFFDVDSSCNAHLFFWFFPAEVGSEEAPLIVWHGGGPGSSGLSGLFYQHGPFLIHDNGTLGLRSKDIVWTRTRNVLYLDSPVGTGFSTVDDRRECIVNSALEAARHAYEGLTQFYTLFPDLQPLPLYIFTGSYGGKFGPAIAHEIHLHNSQGRNGVIPLISMNLKGLFVSSGFFDPLTQIDYSGFYSALGLIDKLEQTYFALQEANAKTCILHQNFTCAFDLIEPLIIGLDGNPSRLKNVTGIDFVYNSQSNVNQTPSFMKNHEPFLNLPSVQKAIHVNSSSPFSSSSPDVYANFKEDVYTSIKPFVEELLDSPRGYKFLFSSAQLDLVVPHSTVAQFIDSLSWGGSPQWPTTPTAIWKTMDNVPGGYTKRVGPLTYLFLRNTGHIWIVDQPYWAHEIMTSFTQGNDL